MSLPAPPDKVPSRAAPLANLKVSLLAPPEIDSKELKLKVVLRVPASRPEMAQLLTPLPEKSLSEPEPPMTEVMPEILLAKLELMPVAELAARLTLTGLV